MNRTLFAIYVIVTTSQAVAQMTPKGVWRSVDDKTGQAKAEIRIAVDASGIVTGVIEKSLTSGGDPNCDECTDDRKGKPKLGMEIIRGTKKTDGKEVWEGGKILDPENGKNYTLRLTPIESGKKLEVRGAIGPFGRTQTWERVQ